MSDLSAKRFSTYIAIFFAYITIWADVIFSIPEPLAFSVLWFIVSALKNIIRIVFMLYIASQLPIFAMRQWKRSFLHLPSRPELRGALWVLLFSMACAGIGAVFAWMNGLSNPLFVLLHLRQRTTMLSLLPFLLLSSLSVGYAEELFFRFFLIDGLTEAGISVNTAAFASICIFAISHYAQGIYGIAFAGVLAALYTSLRFHGYTLHSLALGHALYDAIVLCIVLA